MPAQIQQIVNTIVGYAPNLVGAILILVIGWLIAIVLSAVTRAALKAASLGSKCSNLSKSMPDGGKIEGAIAKGVYYLILLFVLIAFFQALGLNNVTSPLTSLLDKVFVFVPQLVSAVILLTVAWVIATVLKMATLKSFGAAQVDERLTKTVGADEKDPVCLSKTVAEIVYWVVFLLFLPALLDILGLHGLLEPVQGMVHKILDYVPNIITAVIVLAIGCFVARIVEKVVTGFLAAAGADKLSEKLGLGAALGTRQLSGVLGMITGIFVFIPVLITALNALGIEAITTPASNMLNVILTAIPNIFAAFVILAVSYVIARLIAGIVSNVLSGVGFDNVLSILGLTKKDAQLTPGPSVFVGNLAAAILMIFGLTEALGILGFDSLVYLVNQLIVVGGKVVFGLVIIAVGLYIANLVSKIVTDSGVDNASLLSSLARVTIIILSGAMGLRQMGLANEIVNIAFGFLLGAIAVAVALSFGLGGRDAAGRQLEKLEKAFNSNESE